MKSVIISKVLNKAIFKIFTFNFLKVDIIFRKNEVIAILVLNVDITTDGDKVVYISF